MKKMPIVWNALCNTSGERCLLGGVKFLIVPSSEQQLAPCQGDFADILRMTWWWAGALTADAWTEFLCYHPFHTLKYSRFIKTLRYSHKRTSHYFPRVTAKESKNKIPSLLLGCKHFMLLCDLTSQKFQGRPCRQGGGQGQRPAGSEPVLGWLWWSCLLYQMEKRKGALRWAEEAAVGFNSLSLISLSSID